VALFINGLPVATFELKNSLTKQTVADAVAQYQRDRDPREKLFEFGRCVAHLAVDEQEVRFCSHLTGKGSWKTTRRLSTRRTPRPARRSQFKSGLATTSSTSCAASWPMLRPTVPGGDKAHQNAKKNSEKQNARIEHDKALARVMTAVLKDDTELFKQFMDNERFRRWLTNTVFGLTYDVRPS
jgi:type I site-specific restriction-modification system R (restriction) subunit